MPSIREFLEESVRLAKEAPLEPETFDLPIGDTLYKDCRIVSVDMGCGGVSIRPGESVVWEYEQPLQTTPAP